MGVKYLRYTAQPYEYLFNEQLKMAARVFPSTALVCRVPTVLSFYVSSPDRHYFLLAPKK
jgi:hypothetical protein